eukprot:9003502-Lingulodinium_polyedra.AAC.1
MLPVSDFHTIKPQAEKLAPKRPAIALPTVEEEPAPVSITEPGPQDRTKDSPPLDETCDVITQDSTPLEPPTFNVHFEH